MSLNAIWVLFPVIMRQSEKKPLEGGGMPPSWWGVARARGLGGGGGPPLLEGESPSWAHFPYWFVWYWYSYNFDIWVGLPKTYFRKVEFSCKVQLSRRRTGAGEAHYFTLQYTKVWAMAWARAMAWAWHCPYMYVWHHRDRAAPAALYSVSHRPGRCETALAAHSGPGRAENRSKVKNSIKNFRIFCNSIKRLYIGQHVFEIFWIEKDYKYN